MKSFSSPSLLALLALPLLLGACEDMFKAEPLVDHRIKVVNNNGQLIAVAPDCVDWEKGWGDPLSNDPWPSYGCAHARNLAAQIANPTDLIEGQNLEAPDAVVSSAAIARYQSGETTPLINPKEDKPVKAEKLKDTRTGGAPIQ